MWRAAISPFMAPNKVQLSAMNVVARIESAIVSSSTVNPPSRDVRLAFRPRAIKKVIGAWWAVT